MFKHISYDIIMISTLIFGTLVTSFAISEEIEGRTALTVMSKPISRRSFLLGKFIGVLMASGAMASILTGNATASLIAMREFDQINIDRAVDSLAEQSKAILIPQASYMPEGAARDFSMGITRWWAEEFSNSLGTMLVFGQVMILIAIATALATRLPFVVNLTVVLFIYLFGNLAPVIVRVSQNPTGDTNKTGVKLIGFFAQMFDTLLPALEFFNMGPAIIRDTPLQIWSFAWYVVTVLGYSAIYTLIALLIGLLLFEDRDLA
jgi:ABC-type transport system involved in multi-copper enzyme maturation permease subunit